jgi:hypothetical protein
MLGSPEVDLPRIIKPCPRRAAAGVSKFTMELID